MSEIDEVRLQSLPKVELHVHLEGTITPETALLLAQRHGTNPSTLGLVDGRYPRFNKSGRKTQGWRRRTVQPRTCR